LTVTVPSIALWGQSNLGGRFIGPYVQLFFGAIILSFMSGVLWGFATKATGQMATASYVLSVIPALWAFFMTGGGPTTAAVNLIVGFLGLLLLDWHFWRLGLAPPWWMHLRGLLTAIVILSLLPLVL
jgi:hypothetical protein